MHSIYRISNLLTGKQYIGRTKRAIEKRLNSHFYEALSRKTNMYLHNSIRKYGKEYFVIEELEGGISENEISQKEVDWILKENTIQPNGYNEHAGGNGGSLYASAELRKKFSNTRVQNLLQTPIYNKGVPMSDMQKKKLSKKLTGKTKTEEHTERLKTSKRRTCYLIDPEGNVKSFRKIGKFCKENDLTVSCVGLMLSGKKEQHKGWKLDRVEYDAS